MIINSRFYIAVICSLITACGGSTGASDDGNLNGEEMGDILFEIIECGDEESNHPINVLGVGELRELVDNSHRFVDLYLAVNPNSQNEIPEIDFNDRNVIAISAGQRPSGGYQIEVEKITGDDLQISVEYNFLVPSGCTVTDSMNYPYCFVSIAATSREAEFIRVDGVVASCPY